jgi:hypothetical protein
VEEVRRRGERKNGKVGRVKIREIGYIHYRVQYDGSFCIYSSINTIASALLRECSLIKFSLKSLYNNRNFFVVDFLLPSICEY